MGRLWAGQLVPLTSQFVYELYCLLFIHMPIAYRYRYGLLTDINSYRLFV